MGNGRWNPSDWDTYATTHVAGKSQAQVFTSRMMKPAYDPAQIAMRESRDSAKNPNATPIILASDVTGSMGMIAHTLMERGLNTLATEIYDRAPVSDPHICVMGVGDAKVDRAPLQVTQFEADISLADQVRELWIESGGGGNGGESYCAAHLFAAYKTVCDSVLKRGRKGYLFTIGDEPVHDGMTRAEIERVLGIQVEADISAAQCVALAQRNWDVFHLILANEGHARHARAEVERSWRAILPERTILLEDVSKLAETVTSIIQVHEGARVQDVADSWSGSTAVVVRKALDALTPRTQGGLRRLGA
jgi:hypothetical protein